jgi:hypothetical protein
VGQGRRSLLLTFAAALAAAAALAPAAIAHPDGLRDRVVASAGERGLRIAATASSQTYLTASGSGEPIQVSRSSAPDAAGDQALVDFLGSLVHGPELSELRVHVGTAAEITSLCGGGQVVACYSTSQSQMYVPDEPGQGLPLEYVLAHEYGHHIASRRSNAPWDALDWGPKHWSSAMRVCEHVRAGALFPGNQGAHYFDDPGEGFADGYARLNSPAPAWVFSHLLLPDARAFKAIRRDVLEPWTGARTRTFRGRLGPRRKLRRFSIPLKLDGEVRVELASRRPGLRAQVELEGQSFARAETLHPGGSFGDRWCRDAPRERLKVTIRRRAGNGRFALRVTWPG